MIAFGLLLRLLLMPFAVQGDIVEHTWITHFVLQGHIDVYSYYFQQFHTLLYKDPPSSPGIPAVGFPPLFYMTFAAYLGVLQRVGILPFLTGWNVLNSIWDMQLNRFLFFVKAFYLPFDLMGLAGFLLILKPDQRNAGAAAWMMNPGILYIAYGWGQADVLVASFVMVAFYFAKQALGTSKRAARYGLYSCLAIGFSAAFKIFTVSLLLLFSVACFRHSRKWWMLSVIAGLAPLTTTVLPFISAPFLGMMLSYRGFLLSGLPIAGSLDFTFYFVFAGYLAILFAAYFVIETWDFDRLLVLGLAVFLLLYGVSVWPPNWILWGMPLIVLATFRRKELFWIYALVNVFYFVFSQAWGNTLWLGLYTAGFDPMTRIGAFARFPGIQQMFPNLASVFVGLSYTGIGASLAFMTFFMWKQRTVESDVPRRPWQWMGILFIPISLGAGTLFLGREHLQNVNLMEAFALKITADMTFFVFYFALIAVVTTWLCFAAIIQLRERGAGIRDQQRRPRKRSLMRRS